MFRFVRCFSTTRFSGTPPTLDVSKLTKQFLKKVHPDLFHINPYKRDINKTSLQALNSFLQTFESVKSEQEANRVHKTQLVPLPSFSVKFFVKDSPGSSPHPSELLERGNLEEIEMDSKFVDVDFAFPTKTKLLDTEEHLNIMEQYLNHYLCKLFHETGITVPKEYLKAPATVSDGGDGGDDGAFSSSFTSGLDGVQSEFAKAMKHHLLFQMGEATKSLHSREAKEYVLSKASIHFHQGVSQEKQLQVAQFLYACLPELNFHRFVDVPYMFYDSSTLKIEQKDIQKFEREAGFICIDVTMLGDLYAQDTEAGGTRGRREQFYHGRRPGDNEEGDGEGSSMQPTMIEVREKQKRRERAVVESVKSLIAIKYGKAFEVSSTQKEDVRLCLVICEKLKSLLQVKDLLFPHHLLTQSLPSTSSPTSSKNKMVVFLLKLYKEASRMGPFMDSSCTMRIIPAAPETQNRVGHEKKKDAQSFGLSWNEQTRALSIPFDETCLPHLPQFCSQHPSLSPAAAASTLPDPTTLSNN